MDAETRKAIQGSVAQIINARELVINIGTNHGVRVGMRFAVLSEHPLAITDPDTGEVLDTIDREKVRVEATDVREKISICKTYRTTYVPAGPLYLAFGSINIASPPRETPETLKAEDKSLPEPLSPADSYVKIKDRVIQIEE